MPEGSAFTNLDALRAGSYPFETDPANWRTVRAYDGPPDASASPWRLFAGALRAAPFTNAKGRLAAAARRSGGRWQIALFSYGREGRLAEKQVFTEGEPDLATRLVYAYDRQGRLTYRCADVGQEGAVSETFHQWYAYDRRGLLAALYASADDTSAARPDTAEVRYRYTPGGQVATARYRGTPAPVAFRYDAAGRLTAQGNLQTAASGFAARYAYFADGHVREAHYHQPASTRRTTPAALPTMGAPPTGATTRRAPSTWELSPMTGAATSGASTAMAGGARPWTGCATATMRGAASGACTRGPGRPMGPPGTRRAGASVTTRQGG